MADKGLNKLIDDYNRLEAKVDERTGRLTTVTIIVVGLLGLLVGGVIGAVLFQVMTGTGERSTSDITSDLNQIDIEGSVLLNQSRSEYIRELLRFLGDRNSGLEGARILRLIRREKEFVDITNELLLKAERDFTPAEQVMTGELSLHQKKERSISSA